MYDDEDRLICPECKLPMADGDDEDEGDRIGRWAAFTSPDSPCSECVDKEFMRSAREDTVPGEPLNARTRPPKFMLRPDEYAKYGY